MIIKLAYQEIFGEDIQVITMLGVILGNYLLLFKLNIIIKKLFKLKLKLINSFWSIIQTISVWVMQSCKESLFIVKMMVTDWMYKLIKQLVPKTMLRV